MRLIIYDCEVFAADWLVVFKNHETGAYTVVHNDADTLKACLSDENIYIGFNSKFYDQFIIKAICCGFALEEVKAVNDHLIGGGLGWEYPPLRDHFFQFNNADIRDDVQQGLSLKAIEGHLGMDIRESTVPFGIDRPLTAAELDETIFYCKHDVDATERLVELRRDYLKTKLDIGRMAGLDEVRALGMTNAKLTAALLQAAKRPHDDERAYRYPAALKREYIPPEVFAFFDKLQDGTLSDGEVFNSKITFPLGDGECVIGYGGIHMAIPNFVWEEGSA